MSLNKILEDSANALMRSVTFDIGQVEEHNLGLDKLENGEFPVIFVLPYVVRDVIDDSGLITSVMELNAFVLDKQLDVSTSDYVGKVVDKEIVEPMRLLGRHYITTLNKNNAIRDNQGRGIREVIYTPTYAMFDGNVHGVAIRANVPVIEGLTGCKI